MRKIVNDLSKILIISLVIILTPLTASAQAGEGLIPRMWKKFTGKNIPARPSPAVSSVPGQKASLPPFNGSAPAMAREDMLKIIKEETGNNEEVLKGIPELKKKKGSDGEDRYTYPRGAEEVNIEDLDDAALKGLLDKVYIQINAYQAKEVARQMEVVEEAQRVSAMQRQMPPAQPQTPPPQPPRPPSPPPQPPRR
ncbi:MAG: hypothetical protein PHI58_00500 [Candidatus Omnitrophica bacterium]|nr:hypothetical protein [Candidatus Omnitrophota bacterium]